MLYKKAEYIAVFFKDFLASGYEAFLHTQKLFVHGVKIFVLSIYFYLTK